MKDLEKARIITGDDLTQDDYDYILNLWDGECDFFEWLIDGQFEGLSHEQARQERKRLLSLGIEI